MAPPLDDATIPAPPPLSPVPDAPEAPPIISRPAVRPAPAATTPTPRLDLSQLGGIKLRKTSEGGDQRVSSQGGRAVVTLEDLKQIKLRPSTPRALPDHATTLLTRPGVIDFSQMSKIKLKTRHDRSPGGTPMKSMDYRPDPKLQTNGVNLNLLEVRRRLQNSPRAALLSGKGQIEENLKTPANTHECWTPSTARAPPPTLAVGEVPPLASLLPSASPTRRPLTHSNSSPVKAELILKPKALLTSNSNSNSSNSNKAPLGHPGQTRSDKENSLENRIKHRMKQARERAHSTATEDLAIKAQVIGLPQKRHRPLSGQR
jgi:hypothetical protein